MNNFHFRKIKQLKDWKSDLNAVLVFAKTDEETRKDTVRYISLLDYAIKQAERVQELKIKNKRYREYLELIKTTGTYGKDISTGEILRTYEANLADEALEGDLDE